MRSRRSPAALRIGTFGYLAAEQRWQWSAETAAMHGYELGEVVPTAELLAAHQHPEDRAVFLAAVGSGGGFCLRQRLTDAAGNARVVIVIAEPGPAGFYVDLTGPVLAQHRTLIDAALPEYARLRGPIEQAAGMLMVVYGIPAGRADELLRARAAEHGLALPRFAQLLCAAVADGVDVPARLRTVFDHALLTVHQRG
ncbi:PAS and ANTAR domain-containing protein [Nocardia asteroides]|uniref:PAS and ANTAR domain-containing protein n=1 Tax=Nocardia asteroides TaxID=1824 RepID=UPI001E2B8169|nr:PAS and ANTAR domain-containing protein [Nocardia asteroides]UGT62844.1 PAS and ANTAR domain-containing protein [Nocardia asteroides]